jgi:hypothetical protein
VDVVPLTPSLLQLKSSNMNEDFSDDTLVEDFDSSTNISSTRTTLTPEKHLDSPIIVSLLHRLKNITNTVLNENKHVRRTMYDTHRANVISTYLHKHPEVGFSSIRQPLMQYSSALDFCKLEPEILTAFKYPMLYRYSNENPYRLQSDHALALRIFDSELSAYLEQMKGILTPQKILKLRNDLTPSSALGEDVVLSACRAQLWSDIIEDYRRTYKKHDRAVKRTYGPVRVIHCDGFSLLKTDHFQKWQLCTYEQLQMIQDCCLARHNVELALRFKFHNGSKNLRSHVQKILKWQERVLTTIGNDGYELVKAPEAVFKAWLNTLTQGDLLKYSSYARTLDKMQEKEAKLHSKSFLVYELDRIVQSVDNIHDAAELFGLSKLSGHPSVYAEKSAESVRKEATPKGTISPKAVRQINRMFKHLTLSGYIKRHSSWPPFLCPPARGTVLKRHYNNQVTTLPMGSYPISDLDSIEFGKFVEYDYSEDYLKFLDDKAICPGASDMAKFWFSGARQESRRLLQKILQMKTFNTRELVERLRQGKFRDDERVIELTQKERELKIAARCFCKLPFEVRTFFTSTEYNLKEQFMSKYMPQQTMTMSSTDTKKRMYNMVKNAKSKSRTLLEVDFSRWNLRWREETVHGIALQLEQIFGLRGVFTQGHPFFQSATVVLTDKHSLPEGANPGIPVTKWPTSSLLWRGIHRGGFEGILQGLWTICTIAMMYWVFYDQNLSFLMAGQGDNQIFAITFDTSQDSMDTQLRKLLATMEVRCALLNHEVKPDECIDSQTVLTYSKDIYVDGNHILYNLKFASRTFKREEIDVPSLSSEIASISACSMACADSVYCTPRAIFWKTFHTIRLLSFRYRSPNYKLEANVLSEFLNNSEMCKFLLLLPGSLGGIPAMSWTRFFMKGEVDDLSWDVAAYRALIPMNKHFAWDLKLLLQGSHSPKSPSLSQLILDPHSIPIQRPRDLKSLIKKAVEDRLLDHTRNIWIREVASDQNANAGTELLSVLSTSRPFYPQIMSDIYSLSPAGIRDALVSRFTMTRTIVGITGNPNFATEIASANARLLRFIANRYRDCKRKKGKPDLPETSYATCKELRHLWGPEIDHKNIGVYNPFDFKLQFTNTALHMISASSRSESQSLHDSIGHYPPNFGTSTKQKTSDHGFKIVTSSSTVGDLKRLVVMYSELGSSRTLASVLTSISRSRSPWSIEQLSTVLPTHYGGAAAHRHDDINHSAFSLLGSRTVPTHLNFCSDLAGKLSGGEFDYPLAFQEFYLTLTNIFQVLTYTDILDSNASIGFLLSDDYEELPTTEVQCEPLKSKQLRWKSHPGNALCYVNSLTVSEVPIIPHRSMIKHIDPRDIRPRDLIYNKLLAQYAKFRRTFKTTASVNLPVDFIDMKEFNHCPLNDLLTGTCWFVLVMAIHTAVVEFTRNAHVVLDELIMKLSISCSAIMTRTMLHPSFSSTRFAVETIVVCEPGRSGARVAADNLAGELYNLALLHLRSRTFTIEKVPLILFADYTSQIAHISEIHATSIIAMQSFDTSKVLVTPFQWLLLKSARYSLLAQSQPLFNAINFRSTVEHLIRTKNVRGEIPEMYLKYCGTTPEEAIRTLRKLPRQVMMRTERAQTPNSSLGPRFGECKMQRSDYDGSLRPSHECAESTDEERIIDSFASLCQRPIGLHSSALSVWVQFLLRCKKQLRSATVLTIGVGHGASSTAAILCGASHVYGVDLRSSFPTISQREATYKPPEIVSNGLDDCFSWSKYLSSKGGDILKLDHANELEDCQFVILDVEIDHHDLASVYQKLPTGVTLIVRIICCEEWIRFYCDGLGASTLYCTSALNSHKQSYILSVNKYTQFNPHANFHRVDVSSTSSWQTTLTKSHEVSIRRINKFLMPSGYVLKEISMSHIREAALSLEKRAFNSNDNSWSSQLLYYAKCLRECANCYETIETITADEILLLEHSSRRILAQWLSNTNIDLITLRDRLCRKWN